MRKLFWSTSLLFAFLTAGFAQEAYLPEVNQAHQVYVYSNEAVVRDAPYGEVTGRIPIGLQMTIETVVDMTEFRGEEDFWFEVSFYYRGRMRNGYVWYAHLAKFGLEGPEGVYFLYRENSDQRAKIRVTRDGRLLDELAYDMPGGQVHRPSIQDDRGVEGWANILTIPYSKVGCNIFSGNVLLAWDSSDLHYIGLSNVDQNTTHEDIWMGNASINYVFPKDEGGRKGHILRVEKMPDRDKQIISEQFSVLKWTEKGLIQIEE
ncbi:MAG: hypothetical protein AAGG75_02890 [Bacteroidota bacterium]